MKTIHRFPLRFIGDTELDLPKSAQVLSLTLHPNGQSMLYCVVDEGDTNKRKVTVRGIMTGEGFELEELGRVPFFLGTLNSLDGFVSHFFITEDTNFHIKRIDHV